MGVESILTESSFIKNDFFNFCSIILLKRGVWFRNRRQRSCVLLLCLPSFRRQCGKQTPITGWTRGVDRCDQNSAADACATGDNFNTGNGIVTLPFRGGYQCCAQFRCKQGGYCDFTVIRNGGTVYQAFGTRNSGITSNGWSSHSACWVTNAAAGTTFQINLESTAGTDCIEETGWRYATFSCAYVSART